jgi:hypothetical protein
VAATGKWRGAPFTIYANPSALPRAYVVPRAEVAAEGTQLLSRLETVDPRKAVLLSANPLSTAGPRQDFTPASYSATDPDRVVVKVTTEHPGLLVVSDTWLPGWRAWLDGQRVEILRGNHAQRAIALPQPGKHLVVMRFWPPGLSAGLAVTGISVCFLILASVAGATQFRWLDYEISQDMMVIRSARGPHFRVGSSSRLEQPGDAIDEELESQPTGVVSGADVSEE